MVNKLPRYWKKRPEKTSAYLTKTKKADRNMAYISSPSLAIFSGGIIAEFSHVNGRMRLEKWSAYYDLGFPQDCGYGATIWMPIICSVDNYIV